MDGSLTVQSFEDERAALPVKGITQLVRSLRIRVLPKMSKPSGSPKKCGNPGSIISRDFTWVFPLDASIENDL
jgi:hypothetical protein